MCVRVCAWKNTEKQKEQPEQCAVFVFVEMSHVPSSSSLISHRKPSNVLCVWLCIVYVVCCTRVKNHEKSVGKYKKRNVGKLVKTRSPSCHSWIPQNFRKRPFSPTHCFYTFPGICRRFRPKVLFQTPKNAFLGRSPIPKVLIMRWKRSQPAKHHVFCAHNPQNVLGPLMWYKEWVQCDVLTQCVHLCMHCEKVFCSHSMREKLQS